jgi:hypothetical protein
LAGSVGELRHAHADGSRERIDALRPQLSAGCAEIIERACAPDSDHRYSSAAELEAALAESLRRRVAETTVVATPLRRRWMRWKRAVIAAALVIFTAAFMLWGAWDTNRSRAVRRRLGFDVPPRSALYLVVDSAVAIVRGHDIQLVPFNPTTASVLAVSSDFGIRTMAGMPPWTRGSHFRLDGTFVGSTGSAPVSLCCFTDGTTDGHFNYATRQDSILLDTQRSRPLAAPSLYSFDRDWSHPRALFPLSPEGTYFGVAYSRAGDSFWLTRNTRDGARIERWNRSGQLLATPVTVEWRGMTGIAVDPQDETLWVGRPDSTGVMRLENFEQMGHHLGSIDLPWPLPIWQSGGVEFQWTGGR